MGSGDNGKTQERDGNPTLRAKTLRNRSGRPNVRRAMQMPSPPRSPPAARCTCPRVRCAARLLLRAPSGGPSPGPIKPFADAAALTNAYRGCFYYDISTYFVFRMEHLALGGR